MYLMLPNPNEISCLNDKCVFSFSLILAVFAFHLASGSLTDEEIQILRDSGIAVTIHDENDTMTLSHHGVPDHSFEGGWGDNPATPSTQNYAFNIPKTPKVVEEKGCVRSGAIGMSLSGAPFYNPYTNEGKNAVDGNCQETFDECSGHPTPDGAYHYHKLPSCLYTGDTRNKLLGVAFDGFPIYGPMDDTGKNWTSADLDKCHGHTYNGSYMYRITLDFPYILGCFHGEAIVPPPSGMTGSRPPPRGKRHATNTGLSNTDGDRRQYRYLRQIINPNNPCLVEEYSSWKKETCYAFCEIPSSDFDQCVPASDYRPTQQPVDTELTTVSSGNISRTTDMLVSFTALAISLFLIL